MVDKYTYQFVENDVCSYIIHAPWEMKRSDKLFLKIDKIENAVVYVAKSRGYIWFNHLDRIAADGMVVDTRMGW